MPRAEQPSTPVSFAPFTYSPLLSAPVTFNAAAENAAIAAVAKQIIRVYMLLLIPTASIVFTLKSGASALSGPITLTAPLFLPYVGVPYYVTAANEAFVISATAVQISGTVWYLQD